MEGGVGEGVSVAVGAGAGGAGVNVGTRVGEGTGVVVAFGVGIWVGAGLETVVAERPLLVVVGGTDVLAASRLHAERLMTRMSQSGMNRAELRSDLSMVQQLPSIMTRAGPQ